MTSPEGLETVYYNTETNAGFTNALIDEVINPAIDTALQQDEVYEEGDFTILDADMSDNGKRIEYDLVIHKDDRVTVINSTMYTVVEDISEAGVYSIRDEIMMSDLDPDTKERYKNDIEVIRKSVVEIFTRRAFKIDTQNNINNVHVQTELGYCVNGSEITRAEMFTTQMEPFVFDLEREAIFERNDLQEIMQALLCMDLINDSDIKRFVERDFKNDFILNE